MGGCRIGEKGGDVAIVLLHLAGSRTGIFSRKRKKKKRGTLRIYPARGREEKTNLEFSVFWGKLSIGGGGGREKNGTPSPLVNSARP